jgi:hypothetical protein
MPEELVNAASLPDLSIRFQRNRANQPGPAFPQSPGIIPETDNHNLLNRYCLPRSFNELRTSYRRFANRQRIDMHSLFTEAGR